MGTLDPNQNVGEPPRERLKPGPPRTELSPSDRLKILEYLEKGYGRQLACKTAGLSFTVFKSTIAREPEFAQAVRDATEISRQTVEELAYRVTMTAEPAILKASLARIDQARQLSRSRKEALDAKKAKSPEAGLSGDAESVLRTCMKYVPIDKLPELLAELGPALADTERSDDGSQRVVAAGAGDDAEGDPGAD